MSAPLLSLPESETHRCSVMRWGGAALAVALIGLTIAGCTRPTDRPIEGARPGRETASPDPIRTLTVAIDTPVPMTPTVVPVASPVLSPVASPTPTGRWPVISTIQPQANSTVPVGVVTISTRVSSLSDIAEATLFVDGQAARATTTGDSRNPTYSATMSLAPGQHQARISVRDDQGRTGGFTWTFTVGDAAPRASPAPAR